MTVAPYREYRETGLTWLSQVPSHWEIRPPKHFIEARAGGTLIKGQCASAETLGLFPGFSASGQDVWLKNFDHEGPGLVLSAVGARCGKTFRADGHWGVVANTGCLLPRLGADRDFLWYLTNNEDWWEKGGTAQPFTRVSETLSRVWAFPPPHEQQAIASFLDRETGKIDALVAEQERLIALLREKRQAVISQAVTKGLDPNVKMKDSGVEWLGEVPAHWEVAPVWLLFELGRGRVISHEEIASNAGDYPVYSSQTENDGEMGRIDSFDFDGDHLTWTTDGANAGTVFRRHGRFNCTNVCGTMQAKNQALTLDYMVHAVQSATASFVRQDINPKLMNNVMAGIRVPVPPEAEQQDVARRIQSLASTTNALSAEANRAIELLRERRAALISAAVTGKIDVRDSTAAAQAAA